MLAKALVAILISTANVFIPLLLSSVRLTLRALHGLEGSRLRITPQQATERQPRS